MNNKMKYVYVVLSTNGDWDSLVDVFENRDDAIAEYGDDDNYQIFMRILK